VTAEPNDGRYAAPGYLLFLRGSNLMAQPFDARRQRTTDSPFVAAENVTALPNRYTGQYSTADTGTLVYQARTGVPPRQLTLFGIEGSRLGVIGDAAPFSGEVFIAPDGRRAAALLSDTGGRSVLSIYDLETGVPTRIALGSLEPQSLAWAPDGKNFALSS